MREILFRGKTVDDRYVEYVGGRWACGSLVHQTEFYGDPVDKYHILYTGEFHCDYYDSVEVIPETIGQFTGLRDKNGNRIFEGDIVKYPWPDKFGVFDIFMEVHYVDGEFLMKPVGNNYYIECWEIRISGENNLVEVVGNIHDSPELLKGD